MAKPPILILQMQRMGDLVLTFPLMLWLQQQYPEHPVWVVAERIFFQGLLPLSPHVAYVAWDALSQLHGKRFHMILNCSHRPEAAELAGTLSAPRHIGPRKAADSPLLHIHGHWQLYRANLVRNNRHNHFHWADLNALDVIAPKRMATTVWTTPISRGGERIGLFLGASQPEKRPSTEFWVRLVQNLFNRRLTPVLLGGPAEMNLGLQVAKAARCPVVNLCGKFDLPDFVRALQELDLCVTPDTGPMHLAAWMGLPCLNLSMGPVNPWETGPYQPGHHVLQAALSCVNCWHCTHPTPYYCRERFQADKTGFIIQRLAQGKLQGLERLQLGSMRLFRTTRGHTGLYHLANVSSGPILRRERIGIFWSAYFAMLHGQVNNEHAAEAWGMLAEASPELVRPLEKAVQSLSRELASALHKGGTLDDGFWLRSPNLLRPLSGYLHLLLQNENYSVQGFRTALACVERLVALWEGNAD